MFHAIETGKIQAGEAGLRVIKNEVSSGLDMKMDSQ